MRSVLIFLFLAIASMANANEPRSFKCIMHRHIILMDDKIEEGKLDTFQMTDSFDTLSFTESWYFQDYAMEIQSSSENYIEAIDEGRTFIYSAGRFHLTFISSAHVTSMSGDCLPIDLVKDI